MYFLHLNLLVIVTKFIIFRHAIILFVLKKRICDFQSNLYLLLTLQWF